MRVVKKVLIIYVSVLLLTVIIPAIICFSQNDGSSSKELINIFNSFISENHSNWLLSLIFSRLIYEFTFNSAF